MPSSVITVQVGQCGNQIGDEFWKTMCQEHGIGLDGTLVQPDQPGQDRKEMFFYEADLGNRYVPRSVLVDLEPRVINKIMNGDQVLHNIDNVFQSPSGGGAGNNWANGYNQTDELVETIFEILGREAENADSLEGFTLCHSISGGTGSGLGSKILEQIKERYPKTILQTYSVFASPEQSSDVVVGPYNSVLALEWLVEHPDLIVVLDNQALYRLATDTMRVQTPTHAHINAMVSKIMTSLTAPMRFYSPVYTKVSHLVAHLNPFPPMQFIQTAYAPFAPSDNKFVMSTSPAKILSRIMEPKALISSATLPVSASKKDRENCPPQQVDHCMLSALAILQSEQKDNVTEVSMASILQKSQKNNITTSSIVASESISPSCSSSDQAYPKPSMALSLPSSSSSTSEPSSTRYTYPPWSSSTLNITSCKLSPYVEHKHHASGLLLANHTNISTVFHRICQQYDQLRKRGAFLDRFEREGVDTVKLMDESREKIGQLVDLYEEATTMEFMEDVRNVSGFNISLAASTAASLNTVGRTNSESDY